MVDKEGIDFSQYTKLTVANAEQSSMASSATMITVRRVQQMEILLHPGKKV